jgi:PAS domain S-box-containing protein
MSLHNQASLRRKLVLVIMLAVGLALFLAMAAFLTLEIRGYHSSAQRELKLLAEVMGESSAVALEVQDLQKAERLFSSLQGQKRIVEAAIVDNTGHLFAGYHRDGGRQIVLPPGIQGDAFTFDYNAMVLTRPITRAGERIGTIYLRADLQELNSRMRWLLAGSILLTLLIGFATLLFAARMSRVITEPILHLADTARRIAARRSIGECVVRESQDEVGILVDAFNAMLEQLGERQTALEESQRLAHLGNWTFDPNTLQFEWSEETFRIFGLQHDHNSTDYRTFKKLIRREDFDILEKAILGTHMGEQPLAGDFRLMKRDGTICWTHITSAWCKDPSDQDILRGTVMDITERKQAEAALLQGQKLESLGVLAGGIAHDFNNLLAALRGNLDLAGTELPKGSTGKFYIVKAEKIIEKAANLTRQLLAYSGKGQFQVKPLDLSQQIKEMGHLLSVSVSKKAELRYEITEGLPAIIGDTSQIQQVIMNLVINASEALKDQDGVVLIRAGSDFLEERDLRNTFAGQDLAPGPYVFLEVQDNGHGMDDRTKERIFDPFFTTKFHGRGLGLAAMLGIVKSHHGGIKVYSEVGKGTTFRILFPSSNVFTEPALQADPTTEFERSGRILVVDDEPDIRLAACDIFEHLGFDVIQASDGREGMELVREHSGQLRMVLLDLTMPHMNGIEFMKALRPIDPLVPVLMTSGFSESDHSAELVDLGLSGFIQKPYSLSSLKTKLREILG